MARNTTNAKASSEVKLAIFADAELFELNDKAIKSAKGASMILQEAAAHGLWNATVHGRPQGLTDLYRKCMANDLAWVASALRTHYIPYMIDLFGAGGVTDANTSRLYDAKGETLIANHWVKRPDAFITFRSKLSDDLPGFALVKTKDSNGQRPANMPEQTAKNISIAKARIAKAGVNALNRVWLAQAKERRAAEEFDADKAKEATVSFLKRIAKTAFSNGTSRDKITEIGRIMGLSADQLTKDVLPAYQATKPVMGETKGANSETETGAELLKSNFEYDDGDDMPVTATNRPEKEASNVHVN